jgi:spermidine/putrescine ABC transporter ATP-binding subunit
MGARVTLRQVSKRYGDVVALHELSLDVARGEVLTILGPSGSGKTTTLMLLAGIAPPTAGRIEVDGRDITELPPYRRDIGVVFQSYALFPHLSVFDNVAFPLRRRGVARRQITAEVEQALDLVQLGRLGHRSVKHLSGGQQQRVALARALVFRPGLLLMDEPLGALDRQLREQMQIEIRHITQAVGITAIYVTHDQEEALTLSDRIAVLRGGRLEQVGTPEALYDAPRTRFVAEFIGNTNLFEGEVTGAAGERVLRTPDGLVIGLPASAAAAPGPAVVSVRPERVRLGRAADPAAGTEAPGARMRGKITDRIFAGGIVKYRVAVGGRHVLVTTGNDGSSAAAGDEVALSWKAEDARVLREERA